MTITYAEAVSVHEQADLLVSGETIAASIDTMAAEITATLSKEMPLEILKWMVHSPIIIHLLRKKKQ